MDLRSGLAAWTLAALTVGTGISVAAELNVNPILLEMDAPTAAGTLTLRNGGSDTITVQTRVLRWSQSQGKETLTPATEIVASPPAVKLAPNQDYVVRIVRIAKTPVVGEESYRVIVDQLPNLQHLPAQSVNLLIRQSIPVFFDGPRASSPAVSWSFGTLGGKTALIASNSGDQRLRLASLRLRDAAGTTISFGGGLLGYALGHASMSWIVPGIPRGFGSGGTISITAQTEKGPINATAQWRGH